MLDSRAEYLSPGSDGLLKTLQKANEIFVSVKQTSDATLDSRLLVSAADLSAKRTTQLNLGDASQGIDIDEFVGRCITFMRHPPSGGANSSNRRRRGRQDDSDEDGNAAENSADDGDAFNWEWLGRQACFPNSVRPPVPGFLLGPLSVQKRFRKQTQRKEKLQKRDLRDAVRPEELKSQDLDKVEAFNLTTLCRNIRELLAEKMLYGEREVLREATEDLSTEEQRDLMSGYGVADDNGIPLFQFVVNPKSFGQTVENLFYVSFLIKEGSVGIGFDSNSLPTLRKSPAASKTPVLYVPPSHLRTDATNARQAEQMKIQGVEKHQAVFHLDYQTWEDLIGAYDIKESIIPHRESDDVAPVGASGWYK